MEEQQRAYENVVFMDEYPHLLEKVHQRRLGQLALFPENYAEPTAKLFEFPDELA